jgi:NAD(P)-dependent dehydrogenase (short-subunit alcohol dehydrogenase family)
MGRLDGRVAIVTGAGRGIGRSVATLLAGQGAAVVVNDLGSAVDRSGSDAGPAGQVAAEIAAAGGKAIANGADVSDHAAAQVLVGAAIEQFGRLDVMICNAGIGFHDAFSRTPTDVMRRFILVPIAYQCVSCSQYVANLILRQLLACVHGLGLVVSRPEAVSPH